MSGNRLTNDMVVTIPADRGAWYCTDCGTNLVTMVGGPAPTSPTNAPPVRWGLCWRTDTVHPIRWVRHV